MNQSHWRAMRWLGAMRLGVVGVLLWMVHASWSLSLIPLEHRLFVQQLTIFYAVAAALLIIALRRWPKGFYWHWATGGILDLVVLTLLVYASGGVRTGLAPLLPVMVAGSSVPIRPRLALSLAAGTALALLGVTAWRALQLDDTDTANFVLAGLIGFACFLAAGTMSLLATRLKAQESLAAARGQDLRTQLSVTRRVISELEQGVVLINAASQIKMLNPAAQRILGPVEVGGSLQAVSGHQVWQVLREAIQSLQEGAPDQSVEVNLPATEGGTRQYRVRALQIDDAMRAEVGAAMFGATPDLHEDDDSFGETAASPRHDTLVLIDDVQSLQERAQQLKLAAMGRLSASIAHEIRNPLGAIRHANSLLSEQLQAQTTPVGNQTRLSRIIEDNTVRINTIVEDVLAIARRDRAQVEPIDLRQFLPALVDEYLTHKQMPAERVRLVLGSEDPIWFDSGHLRQVLSNLLDNALRFAPNTAGSVKLEWAEGSFGKMQLSIADAGPGIEAAQIEHVFEPFYTTHTQGTGLGLFLVREWCLANQAQIRYQRLPDSSIYSGAFIIEPEKQ